VQAIVANKLFPGLLDRYLASRGYTGQLTDETVDPNRADNLFAPVQEDPGTHGRFDDRASSASMQLWATKHRSALIGAGLTIAGFAATMLLGGKPLARDQGKPLAIR
ncbi:MAG: short-chain dehydrogenase, partial [Alphaproteobacteria bacterium]|nr:short-chain dehydrogenase [Alphaproteobacteria bacterium]